MTKEELQERFEFRNVKAEEADQAIEIENICFPPNEACSPKSMTERVSRAQETFLVAVDKETGKIAGFLNGIATDAVSYTHLSSYLSLLISSEDSLSACSFQE